MVITVMVVANLNSKPVFCPKKFSKKNKKKYIDYIKNCFTFDKPNN
jgi:prenyltransferase beta subunit